MDYLGSSNPHIHLHNVQILFFPDYLAHHFTLTVPVGERCRDPSRSTQVMRINCKNNMETKQVKFSGVSPKPCYKDWALWGLEAKGYLKWDHLICLSAGASNGISFSGSSINVSRWHLRPNILNPTASHLDADYLLRHNLIGSYSERFTGSDRFLPILWTVDPTGLYK